MRHKSKKNREQEKILKKEGMRWLTVLLQQYLVQIVLDLRGEILKRHQNKEERDYFSQVQVSKGDTNDIL
jgi:hypothetical protein